MIAQHSKVHQGCGQSPAVSQLARLDEKLKREPTIVVRRALAVAAAGTMLSVCAWFVAAHWETKVAELEFNSRASNVAFTCKPA